MVKPWMIYGGIGLGLVWIFRHPLGWVGKGAGKVADAAGSLAEAVVTSPVFQEGGGDLVLDWVKGLPADVGRILDPPLPPPPPSTPKGDDAYLRWLWKESGEYHPVYNP